jgi:DNA-binding protein
MKVTIAGHQANNGKQKYVSKRRVQYSNGTTLLIGAKPERSMRLYLKNIYTEEREDVNLCKDIKAYGRQVGMRIMTTDIVHNRYCEDVVGCRIRVPVSQVEKALIIETWPDDITCRKWESKVNRDIPRYQQEEW